MLDSSSARNRLSKLLNSIPIPIKNRGNPNKKLKGVFKFIVTQIPACVIANQTTEVINSLTMNLKESFFDFLLVMSA